MGSSLGISSSNTNVYVYLNNITWTTCFDPSMEFTAHKVLSIPLFHQIPNPSGFLPVIKILVVLDLLQDFEITFCGANTKINEKDNVY
jgi:hypothetical protein